MNWRFFLLKADSLLLIVDKDPAARRATAAATRSVSRERFGLGAAIRILDKMKFPTLDEMKFPTRGEVDCGASFWQPFDFVVTFEAPVLGIGRPGGVSGKRAASESGSGFGPRVD